MDDGDFEDAQSDGDAFDDATPASAASGMSPQLPAGVPSGLSIVAEMHSTKAKFQCDASRTIELTEAISKCRDIMAQDAPPFFAFTRFLSQDERHAIWTLFGVCHTFDHAKTQGELDSLRRCLRRAFDPCVDATSSLEKHSVWEALRTVLRRFAVIRKPIEDFADGVATFPPPGIAFEGVEDLLLHAYRNAGAVGLIALPVLADEAILDSKVAEAAVAMGMAIQLTDMLNCIGHHHRTRGLTWIPRECMRRHGVSAEELEQNLAQRSTSLVGSAPWQHLMRELLDKVRPLLRVASRGGKSLSTGGRLAVSAAVRMCSRMVAQIEARGFDSIGPHEEMFSWRIVGDLAGAVWGGTDGIDAEIGGITGDGAPDGDSEEEGI